MRNRRKVLSLKLEEVLDREFIREVLDRKEIGDNDTPRAKLLRSNVLITRVRDHVLDAFASKGSSPRLADFALHTPSELKGMAKLGKRTIRWIEEYLGLLGIVLPETESVHGMSKAARDVLASL